MKRVIVANTNGASIKVSSDDTSSRELLISNNEVPSYQVTNSESSSKKYVPLTINGKSANASGEINIDAGLIINDVRTTIKTTENVTAGTAITVPEHTVNSNNLLVFLDGLLCLRGETDQYVDLSTTTIAFNDDIPADHEITICANQYKIGAISDILVVDGSISASSTNPVSSQAVYSALQNYIKSQGSRGSIGGYELTTTYTSSATISQNSPDSCTANSSVTVNNGASGTCWKKVVFLTSNSPEVTLGSSWVWSGGSPSTLSSGFLTLCWIDTKGIAYFSSDSGGSSSSGDYVPLSGGTMTGTLNVPSLNITG